jgi:hypothetical protein|tara:strand:+ start:267 stop:608 length:342 start_codon:yes stop_codon:yes gene_type:complete
MPSQKERLNLYLDDEMAQLIRRASAVRGVSRASVVTDLLESVRPQLARLVELVEVANAAPAALSDQLRLALDQAYATLAEDVERSDATMDALGDNIRSAVADAVEQTKREVAA